MKKYILHTCLSLLFLLAGQLLYAGGFMMTGPADSYWHPSDRSDTYYKPFPEDYNPFPDMMSEKGRVSIENKKATVSFTQTFYNHNVDTINGYFLLPVPAGTMLGDFTVMVNDEKRRHEVMKGASAKNALIDMVKKARRAGYMNYMGYDLYKIGIYNMPPRTTQEIEISYTQTLSNKTGGIRFDYPISTAQYDHSKVKNFDLEINIADAKPITDIFQPWYNAQITRNEEDGSVAISLKGNKITLQKNVELYYNTREKDVDFSIFTFKQADEDGYFRLALYPNELPDGKVLDKDVTFIVDASEQMQPYLGKVKEGLLYCVSQLNAGDRFNVVGFSDDAKSAFDSLAIAQPANITKAESFIKSLSPGGETNIEAGLKLATTFKGSRARPQILIFISGGEPTVGNTDEDELLRIIAEGHIKTQNVFTFGLGENVNTYLLDMIADYSGGKRHYILDGGGVESGITDFFDSVNNPVLTQVKLYFENLETESVYPDKLTTLYAGVPVTIAGRYETGGNMGFSLVGEIDDKIVRYKYNAQFTNNDQSHYFVPVVWAARISGFLLDEMRMDGESSTSKKEIAQLSERFGIVNPYCTHLVMQQQAKLTDVDETFYPSIWQLPGDSKKTINYKKEYGSLMNDVTGAENIGNSIEVQTIRFADNIEQGCIGQSRMVYADEKGAIKKNVSDRHMGLKGRTVYKTRSNGWVDAFTLNAGGEPERIAFASDEYFSLMQSSPDAAPWLALGTNLRFKLGDSVYEIYMPEPESEEEETGN